MAVCEACWAEASLKARFIGGDTVTRYNAELKAHPEHETEAAKETPNGE